MDPKFEKVSRNAQKWMMGDSMISRFIKNYFDVEEVAGKVDLRVLEEIGANISSPCRIADYDDQKKLLSSYRGKLHNLQSAMDGFVFYTEDNELKMYPEARQMLKGECK